MPSMPGGRPLTAPSFVRLPSLVLVDGARCRGDRLKLQNVLQSGGQFPASIAVHGDLVYVLNDGGASIVQGFRI